MYLVSKMQILSRNFSALDEKIFERRWDENCHTFLKILATFLEIFLLQFRGASTQN